MNLIIDQGNTAVKIGVFEDTKLIRKETFVRDAKTEIAVFLSQFTAKPVNIMLCSVVNESIHVDFLDIQNFVRFDEQTPLPLINRYLTPKELGKDRLANAVAIWKLNEQKNSLSIDLGTCIKYDLVTKDGAYMGGAISPGLTMRYKALNQFTDKLPLIASSSEVPELGRDTATSMIKGVREGIIHEINGFAQRYSDEYPDLTIFMTGGDLKYFDKALKKRIFANPDLTLIGLNEILQHTIQQK